MSKPWRVILVGVAMAAFAVPSPAAVPADFTDSLVAAVGAPTDVAFTPDGRMLVTSQGGTLRVFDPAGALLGSQTLPAGQICSNSERGLLGVAVDPDHSANRYVYLFYTWRKPGGDCGTASPVTPLTAVNRVSRFTLPASNVLDLGSEVVLIDEMPSPAGNHNAGDLAFDRDGYLYVSIGDGGCDYAGGGCGGANDASRDENVLTGKILRVAVSPDGSTSIPASNPFQGPDSERCALTGRTVTPGRTRCQETWTWGLRNPFRFAVDPNGTGTRVFINDVGQGAREEIDAGQAGADYGWNCKEGTLVTGACSSVPPGVVDPVFDYGRGTVPGTTASGCGSITGGAFVPNGVWPPGYDDTYLFADFVCGRVFRLSASAPYAASDFATNLGGGSATSLAFGPYGPTQALYYTTYAGGGQVRRIVYVPPGNTPPVASIQSPADGATFAVGQAVTLSGTGIDLQDGPLPPGRLSWTVLRHRGGLVETFLGPVTGNNLVFTTPAPEDVAAAADGYLEVRLTVTDSSGATGSATRDLLPRKVDITFATVPPGLSVSVNGSTLTGPQTVTSWQGWTLQAFAPASQALGSDVYVFSSWSIGGGNVIAPVTPASPATYTATYQLSTREGPQGLFTLAPCRVVDTRNPAGALGGPALPAGGVRTFDVRDVCGIPPTARAIVANVTVTASTGPGHLRLWSSDELVPLTSTVNFTAGQTRASNAVVRLGVSGSFSVLAGMASGSVHVIVDVAGYFQ
jgi:glucose/arabinose dehydrogenase